MRAVLETANPTAKHARWWTRVYGRGVKSVKIVYRPGRENTHADALSRHPLLPAPSVGLAEDEVQVARVFTHVEEGQEDSLVMEAILAPGDCEFVMDPSGPNEELSDPPLSGRERPGPGAVSPDISATTGRGGPAPVGNEVCVTHHQPESGPQLSNQGVYSIPLLEVVSEEVGQERSCPPHESGYSLSVSAVMPEQVVKEEGDAGPSRRDGVDDWESVTDIVRLFQVDSSSTANPPDQFALEQRRDPEVQEMIDYLVSRKLPDDIHRARRLVLEASLFAVMDGLLYYVDPKRGNRKRTVVPKALRTQILSEVHAGRFAGHFSGRRLYSSLVLHWWWKGISQDAADFVKSCLECAVAVGTGRRAKPPIPVSRPFQILGIDVMDLPLTDRGNRHVVVIQDLFTKWPFVFAVPDQKTERIARLLAEEVIPCFGVPDALLSDRGTNLLSHLMMDLCSMLGVKKLNTTAYHPQCDGAVERFNRTLKTALRKHAARFGCQWEQYLPGILWAYSNTPHSSTGEKPSFLLYGIDCRSPTEAAYLPSADMSPTDIDDNREELMLSLTSARELTTTAIRKAQAHYKSQYDKTARVRDLRVGSWILVHFPHDETGRWRKLSRPWHGVTEVSNTGVVCIKVYFPEERKLHVHQSRVCSCPQAFPAGYYWYGGKRKGPGRPPKWVDRLLQSGLRSAQGSQENDNDPTPRSPGSEDALPTVMDDADSLSEAQGTDQQSHSNPETPPMDPSAEDGVVCGGDDGFLPEECAQHSSGTSSAPSFRESSATPKQPSLDPPAEDSIVKTTPEAVKEPDRESESRVHGRPRRRIERLM